MTTPIPTDPRITEIRWLLENDVEGDLGRRSTAGGQLDTIARGCSLPSVGGTGEPGPRQLKAVEKERAIREAIDRMPALDRRILLAAYTPRTPEELRKLGGLDPEYAALGLQARTDSATLLPQLLAMCAGPKLAEEYDRRGVTVDPVDWLRQLHATARKRSGRPAQRARDLLAALAEDARQRLELALDAYDEARTRGRKQGVLKRFLNRQGDRLRAPRRELAIERWFTLDEVATTKGVSEAAARQALRRGAFSHVRRPGDVTRGPTARVEVGSCCAEAWKDGRVCRRAA